MTLGGLSEIYIWRAGLAINAERYIQHCIRERLVPFIRNLHQNHPIMFWPDKASSHTANATIVELDNLQIPTVPKDCNPTNLPQARPIELVHSLIKSKVFRNQKPPRDLNELEHRLRNAFQEIKANHATVTTNFSKKVRSLINSVYRHGLLSIQK